MRTEKQTQASRANGAKSRGPVTPEGKATSSQNAIRHGILSASLVINGEDPEAFLDLIGELYDEFQPATPFEKSLVDNMAAAQWRQGRLWNMEKSITEQQLDHEYHLAQQQSEKEPQLPPITAPDILTARAFRTLGDDSRALDLISRYESRLDRQYLRSHRRLLEVQGKSPNSPITPQDPPPQPDPVPETPPGPRLVPNLTPENSPQTQATGCRERYLRTQPISAKQTRADHLKPAFTPGFTIAELRAWRIPHHKSRAAGHQS